MEQLEAVGWGVLSASSFPIGCLLGLRWPTVPLWLRGVLMGFGGGVMLSALTISLFGEWLSRPHEFGRGSTSVLLVSALVGGVAFVVVDSFLERRGAWMRRLSAKRKRLTQWRSRRLRPLLTKLRLARAKQATTTRAAHTSLEQQMREEKEMEDMKVNKITKEKKDPRYVDLEAWTVSTRGDGELTTPALPLVIEKEDEADLPAEALEPTPHINAHSLIGLAIWMGLLIDGVPESLVIGVESASHEGVTVALRVAFFLGNLPVALSSSIVMLENGMSRIAIFLMWLMLTGLTGVGAFAGSFMEEPREGQPNSAFLYGLGVAEGIAAGAMLVMIANVMLPEAYRTAGSLSGLSLMCGFLAGLCLELADNW
ncbi:metal cation transporter, ZIP subfamily protein [Acanthamoeba castellanii str. Neff]|uniref:Zinc transporter ZIP11 n=1 Tax=Acanthamoeba castellanii (strain ATCC 30010 / Neff) TaxID=1257118 RepID=L8H8C4_ACACF|nr:metal cation transporter, ZIP subfamily protein [Acanthamoeba castellanii str. Neff]ELR21754.1 metal cation transporter, ZIP subfamily protein [Acanthamoeba castellanii str. Neff]